MDRNEVIKRKRERVSDQDVEKIITLLETVNYGSITLVIQDGKLIQIDKLEKIRLK